MRFPHRSIEMRQNNHQHYQDMTRIQQQHQQRQRHNNPTMLISHRSTTPSYGGLSVVMVVATILWTTSTTGGPTIFVLAESSKRHMDIKEKLFQRLRHESTTATTTTTRSSYDNSPKNKIILDTEPDFKINNNNNNEKNQNDNNDMDDNTIHPEKEESSLRQRFYDAYTEMREKENHHPRTRISSEPSEEEEENHLDERIRQDDTSFNPFSSSSSRRSIRLSRDDEDDDDAFWLLRSSPSSSSSRGGASNPRDTTTSSTSSSYPHHHRTAGSGPQLYRHAGTRASYGTWRSDNNNNKNSIYNDGSWFQPVQDWWTTNIQPNIKNWPKIQCRVEPTTTLKIRKTFRPLKTIVRLSADFNTQLGVWQFRSSWEDAIVGGKLTLAGRELQFQKSCQLSVVGAPAVEDLVTRLQFRAAVDLQTWKAYARVGFCTERLSFISSAFRREGFAIQQQLPLDGSQGHVKLEVKTNFVLPEPEIEYSTESQRSLIGMGDIEVSIEEMNLLLDY